MLENDAIAITPEQHAADRGRRIAALAEQYAEAEPEPPLVETFEPAGRQTKPRVFVPALRCPTCGHDDVIKLRKRPNRGSATERDCRCRRCDLDFVAIFE